mgnify:CR=1 FL=1
MTTPYVRLVGVVTPVQWDGDHVTQVALCATDEKEYRIANGNEFLSLIRQNLRVTGRIVSHDTGHNCIEIKEFSII